jgi:HD-like signal output (HDOD) protein
MLTRLWGWFRGGTKLPTKPQANGVQPPRDAAAASPRARDEQARGSGRERTDAGTTAGNERKNASFLDKLTAERAKQASDGEPLSSDDEQRTSELVQALSYYVSTHAIEPPVMPALASRMLELLRVPDVDVPALVRLIEQDQACSAKLLSISNSAAFRGQNEIGSVRDAIVFLGTEQVAQIAIGLASRAIFDPPNKRSLGKAHDRFGRSFGHAMTSAFSACQLATRRNRRHSDAAFLGGLFHDVGKAVALRALTEMIEKQGLKPAREQVIDAALHQIHREPKAVLYQSWELPRPLMDMCRTHHVVPADAPPELHYVRLVSGLDTLRLGSEIEKQEALTDIAESSAALRLTDAELRVAHTETGEFAERVRIMFG